jgi:hypothetical protein
MSTSARVLLQHLETTESTVFILCICQPHAVTRANILHYVEESDVTAMFEPAVHFRFHL